MTRAEVAPDTVELKGRIRVPLEAVRLALALEDQGHRLRVTPTRLLYVSPSPTHTLSTSDQDAIRRWKPDLMVIAQYRAADYEEA